MTRQFSTFFLRLKFVHSWDICSIFPRNWRRMGYILPCAHGQSWYLGGWYWATSHEHNIWWCWAGCPDTGVHACAAGCVYAIIHVGSGMHDSICAACMSLVWVSFCTCICCFWQFRRSWHVWGCYKLNWWVNLPGICRQLLQNLQPLLLVKCPAYMFPFFLVCGRD